MKREPTYGDKLDDFAKAKAERIKLHEAFLKAHRALREHDIWMNSKFEAELRTEWLQRRRVYKQTRSI